MNKDTLLIREPHGQGTGKALIMLHGRGGSSENILLLANHLNVEDFKIFAPQAINNSWYPNSFMSSISKNEPWLSLALTRVKALVTDLILQGILKEKIYFLGFSQGACLLLEFITRNADKYGGAAAFTGGLIGDKIYPEHYSGDFKNTPVFIGSSDPDFHVPLERVNETAELLKKMGAKVTERIYKNMGHTIIQEEFDLANQLIFNP